MQFGSALQPNERAGRLGRPIQSGIGVIGRKFQLPQSTLTNLFSGNFGDAARNAAAMGLGPLNFLPRPVSDVALSKLGGSGTQRTPSEVIPGADRNPWLALGTDIVLDPLNLVSFGGGSIATAPGKGGRIAMLSARAARMRNALAKGGSTVNMDDVFKLHYEYTLATKAARGNTRIALRLPFMRKELIGADIRLLRANPVRKRITQQQMDAILKGILPSRNISPEMAAGTRAVAKVVQSETDSWSTRINGLYNDAEIALDNYNRALPKSERMTIDEFAEYLTYHVDKPLEHPLPTEALAEIADRYRSWTDELLHVDTEAGLDVKRLKHYVSYRFKNKAARELYESKVGKIDDIGLSDPAFVGLRDTASFEDFVTKAEAMGADVEKDAFVLLSRRAKESSVARAERALYKAMGEFEGRKPPAQATAGLIDDEAAARDAVEVAQSHVKTLSQSAVDPDDARALKVATAKLESAKARVTAARRANDPEALRKAELHLRHLQEDIARLEHDQAAVQLQTVREQATKLRQQAQAQAETPERLKFWRKASKERRDFLRANKPSRGTPREGLSPSERGMTPRGLASSDEIFRQEGMRGSAMFGTRYDELYVDDFLKPGKISKGKNAGKVRKYAKKIRREKTLKEIQADLIDEVEIALDELPIEQVVDIYGIEMVEAVQELKGSRELLKLADDIDAAVAAKFGGDDFGDELASLAFEGQERRLSDIYDEMAELLMPEGELRARLQTAQNEFLRQQRRVDDLIAAQDRDELARALLEAENSRLEVLRLERRIAKFDGRYVGSPEQVELATRRAVRSEGQLAKVRERLDAIITENARLAEGVGTSVGPDEWKVLQRTWAKLDEAAFGAVRVNSDIAQQMQRAQRIIRNSVQSPADIEGIHRFIQGFTSRWKGLALLYPGYHIRNLLDDGMRAYMGGARNPRSLIQSGKAMRAYAAGRFDEVVATIDGRAYTAGDLIAEADSMGALGGGQVVQDFSRGVRQIGPLRGSGPGRGPLVRMSAKLGQIREDWTRLGMYIEMRKAGMDQFAAARRVREFLFDYGEVGAYVEAMRRTYVPFVAFTAKAIPFTARTIVRQPRYFSRLATLMDHAHMNAEGREPGQNFDPGAFTIPTGPLGDAPIIGNVIPDEAASVGPTRLFALGAATEFLPFFREGGYDANRLDAMRLLGNLNPAAETTIALATDRDTFFGGSLSARSKRVPLTGVGPIPEQRIPAELDAILGLLPAYGQYGRVSGGTDEKSLLSTLRWLTGVPIYHLPEDQEQRGPRKRYSVEDPGGGSEGSFSFGGG